MRCFSLLMLCGVLFGLMLPGWTAPVARPTCALLADNALDFAASPCYALLETRLLEDARLDLLERAEIAQILKEQKLSLAFSPEGGQERVAVGKLLKANLLFLLKAGEQSNGKEKVRTITLAVSETTRGLRLYTQTIPWTANPETDVIPLQQGITQALAKYGETITEICAIPPFVSNDLMHRNDHLQEGYARLVEQALLQQKGLVVVELAEARALSNEQTLTANGDGIARQLPLYFQGEYRVDGVGDAARVTVQLALYRGKTKLGSVEKTAVQPTEAGAFLLNAAGNLLAKAANIPVQPHDADTEAKQLYERAQRFSRIGNWTEALTLLDASLLLNPKQPDVLYDAGKVASKLVALGYDPYGGFANFSRKALQAIEYAQRMTDYTNRYVAASGKPQIDPSVVDRKSEFFVGNTFDGIINYSATYGKGPDGEAIRQRIREYLQHERDRMLQIVDAKPEATIFDKSPVAARLGKLIYQSLPLCGETTEQQYALKLRAITALNAWGYNDQIYNIGYANVTSAELKSDRMGAFIEEVAKLNGTEAGLKHLRELRQSALAPKPNTAQPATPPAAPAKDPEIRFPLIKLMAVDANQRPTQLPYSFWGWIPCGNDVDAIWGPKDIFLMKTKGVLSLQYRSTDPFFNFLGVCYDGKYLWLPAARKTMQATSPAPVVDPFMLVLDPKTGERWEFTAIDGLPDMTGIQSTPVSPGTICIVGSTDRTWCALVSLSPAGKKTIDIFHEARLQPDPKLERGDAARDPKLAFRPNFIGRLGGVGTQEVRIIVGRELGLLPSYPLLIDPKTRNVSVVPVAMPSGLMYDTLAEHEGAIYWVGRNSGSDGDARVQRIALPDVKSTPVSPEFPGAFFDSVLFDGQQIHVLGSYPGQWWTASRLEEPYTKLEGKVVGRDSQRRVMKSNFYGLLINPRNDTLDIYTVEMLKTPTH